MAEFHRIKNDLEKLRVLVIGDIMLDFYMHGHCERISPEAPVPVVDIFSDEITLGGAGNVAKNLISFGVKTDILAVIGDDFSGTEVESMCDTFGISREGLFIEQGRTTSKKTRILVTGHQMIRFDRESKAQISKSTEGLLLSFVKDNLENYDLVIISDYEKGMLTENLLGMIFSHCRCLGIKTIVDPKGNNYKKYIGANYIKPNKKEALTATGLLTSKKSVDLKLIALKIKRIVKCDAIIITLAHEGMALYSTEYKIIPTIAKEIFDVTGAGDTTLAAIGLCISLNFSIYDACLFANHAASLVVGKIGSATTTIEEILEKLYAGNNVLSDI